MNKPAELSSKRISGSRLMQKELAIVVPAFNEAKAIGATIAALKAMLARTGIDGEIVVVDDGSKDGTGDAAEAAGVRVIRQEENSGYGYALKTGIAATQSKFVAIIDADGTYPVDKIPEMLELCRNADMVVGDRGADMKNVPLIRRPPKWVLNTLANVLARRKIPDLNSGLRVFKRDSLERFVQLLPDGFSFTTTITLSMMCSNLRVVYTPIAYSKRVGQSSMKPTAFFTFILLVLRIIVFFQPLRVFMPLGGVLFLLGMAKVVYDFTKMNLSESAIFALLAALVVWSLGLIADMISRLHLRPRPHSD
ncbi:MAG: glycosyltransferase family 2 protein [Parvularculaceae bacterium]|nr:glycosyltransferase family 2 protein [Parvularculaceae bacterium]